MKTLIRSTGTRELAVALFTLASAACSTTANVPPEELVPFPGVERATYVTLPGRGVADKSLREQYVHNGRRAIGHTRARCVTAPGSPCRETVDVRITAVEGAKYIDPARPPRNPQLLAWVENFGDKPTYDGFEPAARFVYALVVDAPPAGDTEKLPIIYRVGFSTDPDKSRITQDVYGHVYPCHNYIRQLFSEADFQPCYGHGRYANKTDNWPLSALVTSLSMWSLSSSPSDPTWFACSSGCCTSSAVQ